MILDHNGRNLEPPIGELRQLDLTKYLQWLTHEPSSAFISPTGSYKLSTVYSCIKILADSIAMTKLRFYEQRPRARERTEITRGRFARIAKEASPLFNNFTFWQSIISSLYGWGNGYAVIIRENGVPTQLIYLEPSQVSIQETPDPRFEFLRGDTPYYYQVSTGMQTTFVLPEDMVHLVLFSYDGIEGVSPVQLHQDTFQVEDEQTKYGRSFYSSGGKITGVIESPRQTSRADAVEFVTWFNEFYGGTPGQTGAGRIAFLPNGLEFKAANVVNPQDAEYVNARRLTRAEIASIYRVPLYLIGELERATWNNVTQLSEEFVRYTLNPLYSLIETELNRKLLDNSDQLFYEFDSSVLLRGTVTERYANYATGINAGFLSPAEVREKEGLPFVEELDYFLRMPGSEAVGEEDESELDEVEDEVRMKEILELRQQQGERNLGFELGIEKLKLNVDNLSSQLGRLESELCSVIKDGLEWRSSLDVQSENRETLERLQESVAGIVSDIGQAQSELATCLELRDIASTLSEEFATFRKELKGLRAEVNELAKKEAK